MGVLHNTRYFTQNNEKVLGGTTKEYRTATSEMKYAGKKEFTMAESSRENLDYSGSGKDQNLSMGDKRSTRNVIKTTRPLLLRQKHPMFMVHYNSEQR